MAMVDRFPSYKDVRSEVIKMLKDNAGVGHGGKIEEEEYITSRFGSMAIVRFNHMTIHIPLYSHMTIHIPLYNHATTHLPLYSHEIIHLPFYIHVTFHLHLPLSLHYPIFPSCSTLCCHSTQMTPEFNKFRRQQCC